MEVPSLLILFSNVSHQVSPLIGSTNPWKRGAMKIPPGFREDHKDNETPLGLAVHCEREWCMYKSRHSPYIPEMFPMTWQVEWFIGTSLPRKCQQPLPWILLCCYKRFTMFHMVFRFYRELPGLCICSLEALVRKEIRWVSPWWNKLKGFILWHFILLEPGSHLSLYSPIWRTRFPAIRNSPHCSDTVDCFLPLPLFVRLILL